jgi:hypothetical protein
MTQERIVGITLDSIDNLNGILTMLKSLPKKPWVRIVFDEDMKADDYYDEVKAISPHATILGEILDSYYVRGLTLRQYAKRTEQYVGRLGEFIHHWEVGNEVNGDWLGKNAAAKFEVAHEVVKSMGHKSVLTGYHEIDQSPSMAEWLERTIPSEMKLSLDYVLVSYYDHENGGKRPDSWDVIFQSLRTIFPKAFLGFGECGTEDKKKKEEFFRYYYSLFPQVDGFVGGCFWWYGHQDFVGKNKPLLRLLQQEL